MALLAGIECELCSAAQERTPCPSQGERAQHCDCVNRERGLQMQGCSLPSAALVPRSALSPRDGRGRGDGAGSCPARGAGLQDAFVCRLRALTQAGGAVLAESPFETCGSVSGREREGSTLLVFFPSLPLLPPPYSAHTAPPL